MFLIFFLILLIQFFTFWIFEPFVSFLEYFLEIKLFPIVSLLGFILIFSAKNIDQN